MAIFYVEIIVCAELSSDWLRIKAQRLVWQLEKSEVNFMGSEPSFHICLSQARGDCTAQPVSFEVFSATGLWLPTPFSEGGFLLSTISSWENRGISQKEKFLFSFELKKRCCPLGWVNTCWCSRMSLGLWVYWRTEAEWSLLPGRSLGGEGAERTCSVYRLVSF